MNSIHANFRWISIISACLLLISGCQSPSASEPMPTATKAESAEVVPTQTATKTPAPTSTNTPIPTDIPTKTPIEVPEGAEVVYMQAADGSDLIGYLRQPETPIDAGLVAVLTHAWNGSHNEWRSFEEVLNDNGIATITFDFRGRNAQGAILSYSTIGEDVQTVVEQMRERGYERVVCIGSGMGGTACIIGAVNTGVEGLVILSAEWSIVRSLIYKSDVSDLEMPKLVAFNEQDATLVGGSWTVEGFHETAELLGEPKEIYVYQGFTTASAMLVGEDGDELQTHILDFVKRIAE